MPPGICESVQPLPGMPVKQTHPLLLIGKLLTQMGSLMQSAVRFPFFGAVDGAFLPFLPGSAFVFFGLVSDPLFIFFMAPVPALLAAFLGLPLDLFFFFFKVLLLSSNHLAESIS